MSSDEAADQEMPMVETFAPMLASRVLDGNKTVEVHHVRRYTFGSSSVSLPLAAHSTLCVTADGSCMLERCLCTSLWVFSLRGCASLFPLLLT
jgi:hypothetical protein